MRAFLLGGLFLAGGVAHAAVPQTIEGMDASTQTPISLGIKSAVKGTVVVFLSAKCPCSMSHERKLSALADRFSKQGFSFLGVHSNADEPLTLSHPHFQAAKLGFPVVEDPKSELAEALGALKTPHAFVINREGKVLFEGGVDDSHLAQASQEQFLENALVAVSEGHLPAKAKARALGCVIQRP